MNRKIVVLGATGNVGQSLTGNLLAAGADVVPASRSGQDVAGVRGVQFDYAESSTFREIGAGADAVYIMLPTGYPNVSEVLRPILETAKKDNIRVVLHTALEASVNSAHHTKPSEDALIASGVRYSIVRPSWYMQNFLMFWPNQLKAGLLELPTGDGRMSLVHVEDIGASAAAVLLADDTDGQAYDITGPEAFSFAEALAIISEHVGRTIAFHPITREEQIARSVAAGGSPEGADFMAKAYDQVKANNAAAVTDDVERLTGQPPRTLRRYIAENEAAFRL